MLNGSTRTVVWLSCSGFDDFIKSLDTNSGSTRHSAVELLCSSLRLLVLGLSFLLLFSIFLAAPLSYFICRAFLVVENFINPAYTSEATLQIPA